MTAPTFKADNSLKGKSAVIVCHDWVYGPPHALRDYLLTYKIQKLLFIGHPNQCVKGNVIDRSYGELYQNGKLVKKWFAQKTELPELIAYLRDSITTLVWTIQKMSRPVTFFFGVGNLNAFIGILLSMLGLVHSVVYYVIDYIPNRFENKFANRFYHWIEYICARFSAITWNYSGSMILARNKYWKKEFPRQIVSPNGVDIRNSTALNIGKIHIHEILYVGTLVEQQGVKLIIDAIPLIAKIIPDVTLTIIGQGTMEQALKKRVKELGISTKVNFLGFIKDSSVMDERIKYASVGIAPYIPGQGIVGNTEPGKVKRYLASGVPVIMTNISSLAADVVKSQCGFVIRYDVQDLAKTVISFLGKPESMEKYRKNALKFAKQYTWEKIFTEALSKTFTILPI